MMKWGKAIINIEGLFDGLCRKEEFQVAFFCKAQYWVLLKMQGLQFQRWLLPLDRVQLDHYLDLSIRTGGCAFWYQGDSMVNLSNMSGDEHFGVFSESNKDIIYGGWRVGATRSWSQRETPDVVFIHPSNMTRRRVEADSFGQCDRLIRMDLGRLVEIGIWNSFHLAQCEVHDLGIDQSTEDDIHGIGSMALP